MLPCGLPARVKALGVGWAFVDSVHVEDDVKLVTVKVRLVKEDSSVPFWWTGSETYDHRNTHTTDKTLRMADTMAPA